MTDNAKKHWSIWSMIMAVVLLLMVLYTYREVREYYEALQVAPPPVRFVIKQPGEPAPPEPTDDQKPGKTLPRPVINADPSHMRWATAREVTVLWNIDRDEFLSDKMEDLTEYQEITGEAVPPTTTYQFARSVPNPEGVYETPEVVKYGLTAVRDYLRDHNVSPVSDLCEFVFDEEHFFSYLGKEDLSDYSTDRTLSVSVQPRLFGPDFVRMIQKRFLAKWPLWRVYLIANDRDGEEHLLIYPDRIFIGDTEHLPAQMDEPIRKWQAAITKIREPVDGPQRRQFQYLLPLLPAAVAKLKTEPVVLLAVFDSIYGKFDGHSMWFLNRRTQSLDVKSPEERSHGHQFIYVNERGEIVRSKDPDSIFEIEEIGLKAADIGNVVLEVGRKPLTWKPSATLEMVVKDADLRQKEGKDKP